MMYWQYTDGLDVLELAAAVEKAAEREPGKIYQSCPMQGYSYTHVNDVPGCLIGQAIYDMTGYLADPKHGALTGSLEWLAAFGLHQHPGMDPERTEAYEFVCRAQEWQDEHLRWGAAVAMAKTGARPE